MTTLSQCPHCDNVELIPGYAIDPKDSGGYRCCMGNHSHRTQKAEDIEIVFTAKCPVCGHGEELSPEHQAILQAAPPPNYESWAAYWASEKKVPPCKWLRDILNLD